jgi:hypothetical protein
MGERLILAGVPSLVLAAQQLRWGDGLTEEAGGEHGDPAGLALLAQAILGQVALLGEMELDYGRRPEARRRPAEDAVGEADRLDEVEIFVDPGPASTAPDAPGAPCTSAFGSGAM